MFDNAKGFLVCSGLAVPEETDTIAFDDNIWIVDRRLHKFKKSGTIYRVLFFLVLFFFSCIGTRKEK